MEPEDKLQKNNPDFIKAFWETSFPKPLYINEILDTFSESKEVSLAGRLISKREHGKSGFAHLSDHTGKIQFYAQADKLGEQFKVYKDMTVGDICGIRGKLFTTRTG